MKSELRIIGLTGGIASGKSLVAEMFRKRGIKVLDADEISREVVKPGSEALAEIVKYFGHECISKAGELDRKKLGEIIFSDDKKRKKLEIILHPRIIASAFRKAYELFLKGFNPVLFEAALLIETRMQNNLNGVIVVLSPEETRIDRIIARDGLTREEAFARIRAQISDDERRKAATWIIENNGSVQDLDYLVENIFKKIT